MLIIEVKKENINRALKELRFKFRNTKRLQRLKDLKYFEKPSAKRRLSNLASGTIKLQFFHAGSISLPNKSSSQGTKLIGIIISGLSET